jgi:hypothetical protein
MNAMLGITSRGLKPIIGQGLPTVNGSDQKDL